MFVLNHILQNVHMMLRFGKLPVKEYDLKN